MKQLNEMAIKAWTRVGARWLPFADAVSEELPLNRLLRLSLFQIAVGMVLVLTNGTLNRVMIVELGAASSVVALMVALPLLFAPFRVLIGHRSDHHRSALGWRRVPYIWIGSMLQFGGLAIMPFALLVMSGDGHGPAWIGTVAAALAFLMVGAGMHTSQTAGLALATDLAPAHTRARVVALLYVMLLAGMVGSSALFGWLLEDFSPTRLVQVIQGAAILAIVLNLTALWKQEARTHRLSEGDESPQKRHSLKAAWQRFAHQPGALRLLVAVGLGTAAFSMQDILLEPYGGHILAMSVSQTTMLTGLLAAGTLAALALSARVMDSAIQPARLAAIGVLLGIVAFSAVVFAGALQLTWLFQTGTALIGFGAGLFAVGLLTEAMRHGDVSGSGVALGAWGAVQATAAGLAIGAGGLIRDTVQALADSGYLGIVMANSPQASYGVVYHLEILLLFVTLIAIGPLVRAQASHDVSTRNTPHGLELYDFPN